MNKYVGESELAVRTLFRRARTCSPCILFFDEFCGSLCLINVYYCSCAVVVILNVILLSSLGWPGWNDWNVGYY